MCRILTVSASPDDYITCKSVSFNHLGTFTEDEATLLTVSRLMHLQVQVVTGHSECSLQGNKFVITELVRLYNNASENGNVKLLTLPLTICWSPIMQW